MLARLLVMIGSLAGGGVCVSFRHDVMALLLAPFVEAPTVHVADKGF